MAKLSPNTINTTLIQDGQAPGSITPSDVRSIVSSLAGLPSKTVSESNYTLVVTDDGMRIRMSSASVARTMTVPPFSSVAFDTDTVIVIYQVGIGAVTITAGAGVTINTPLTTLVMSQYQTIVLQQDSQDVWIAS